MAQDTKGVIRSRKLKNGGQYNDQMKKDKQTNSNQQNITLTTKVQHELTKIGNDVRCSDRVNRFI